MSKEYVTDLNWIKMCTKLYRVNEPLDLVENDIVYVPCFFVNEFIRDVGFPCPIHLVSAFGDCCIHQFIDSFPQHVNILSWRITNCMFDDPKIIHILNGLLGDYPKHDLIEKYKDVPKMNKVFYAHNPCSNIYDRIMYPLKKYSEVDYYKNMAECKYVLCVNGSGSYALKVSEAIALGCIPIIKVPSQMLKAYDSIGINYVCLPGYTGIIGPNSWTMNTVQLVETPYIHETNTRNSIKLYEFNEPLIQNHQTSHDYLRYIAVYIHNNKQCIQVKGYTLLDHLKFIQSQYEHFKNGILGYFYSGFHLIRDNV